MLPPVRVRQYSLSLRSSSPAATPLRLPSPRNVGQLAWRANGKRAGPLAAGRIGPGPASCRIANQTPTAPRITATAPAAIAAFIAALTCRSAPLGDPPIAISPQNVRESHSAEALWPDRGFSGEHAAAIGKFSLIVEPPAPASADTSATKRYWPLPCGRGSLLLTVAGAGISECKLSKRLTVFLPFLFGPAPSGRNSSCRPPHRPVGSSRQRGPLE